MTSRYFAKAMKEVISKPAATASHYILGNPQARAIATATELRTFAARQGALENKRLRSHQQKIDVQTADSHGARQNTYLRMQGAEKVRIKSLKRAQGAKEQRTTLMQDKVAYNSLSQCYHKMLESRWADKGLGLQSNKDERSRILLGTVLEQWQKQVILRAVSNWMSKWWSDMFPQRPIIADVTVGSIKDSDIAVGLSLQKCPAVFLEHAEDQRRRIEQERIIMSTKGAFKSYQIFENQRKAQMRIEEMQGRIKNGLGRAAQSEYRRHHIEPAPIYISIWHPADKHRALKRIRANRARWLYEKAKWVVVDTGGPAGVYYYHADSNSIRWELPTREMLQEMQGLLERAKSEEAIAGFPADDTVIDLDNPEMALAGETIGADNYHDSYNGPC